MKTGAPTRPREARVTSRPGAIISDLAWSQLQKTRDGSPARARAGGGGGDSHVREELIAREIVLSIVRPALAPAFRMTRANSGKLMPSLSLSRARVSRRSLKRTNVARARARVLGSAAAAGVISPEKSPRAPQWESSYVVRAEISAVCSIQRSRAGCATSKHADLP